MKMLIRSLLAVLLLVNTAVAMPVLSTRVLWSNGRSSSYPTRQLTGYRVKNKKLEEVEPRTCGPFLHWNLDRFPDAKIPYYINRKGSKDLSLVEIKLAVEQAFNAWKEIDGVALDFRFAGYTDASGFKQDNKNVIFFDESREIFTDNDDEDALGATKYAAFYPTGELHEVDIALNGTYLRPLLKMWKDVSFCAGDAFKQPLKWNLAEQRCMRNEYRAHLQSTLIHEIGHFIGLGHSKSRGATMWPTTLDFLENTNQSTLEQDDGNGARFLYPSDMRVFSAPVEPYNIALGRSVHVTTNGANDGCNYCEKVWADITDGRYDYELRGDGQIKDGVVGWQNNDYNELMEVTVTIDLGQRFTINKIRYATGNVHRTETWNADTMISPFGKTATRPGSNRMGVWTEHSGNLRASQVEITFQKTRKRYEEDWLFIGEIEIIGTPIEDYSSSRPTLRRRLDENTWEGNVNSRLCWQDTGLTVMEGQSIEVSASGTVTWDPNINAVFGTVSPNGSGYPASRIAAVRQESFLVKSANTGSLIMRIGDLIYAVGKSSKFRVDQRGTVQLMINDEPEWLFDNSGRFFVRVRKE